MRTASKSIALIKRIKQKESVGGILLPDEFTIGNDSKTSKYRWAEVVDMEGLAPGTLVAVGEMSSVDVDTDIHRAPVDFVLAYMKDGACYPLRNLILIKLDPKKEKISGTLLFMPDCSKPPNDIGEIIAIGPEVLDPDIKVGARALIAMFSGLEIYVDGVGECVLVREKPLKNHSDELLCIIEEAPVS